MKGQVALWLRGPESGFVSGTTPTTTDGGLLAGMPPFAKPEERP